MTTEYRKELTTQIKICGESFNLDSTSDKIVKWILFICASVAIIMIFFIIYFLFTEGGGFFGKVELSDFIFGTNYLPSHDLYGAGSVIVGTILVTFLAMVIAIPLGIGSAIYIAEIAPPKVRKYLKFSLEILSGVPSVVWGYFGAVIFNSWIMSLFGLETGHTWLSGSIILAIMTLPTIISVCEDAISSVPNHLKEASLGLGATKWQTISKAIIPAAMSGITAAIILGIGRAIGETIALQVITGGTKVIPNPLWNIFSGIQTIASTINLQFNDAHGLGLEAIFALGIVLFLMTLMINSLATIILSRIQKRFAGEVKKNKSKASIIALNIIKGILCCLLLWFLITVSFGNVIGLVSIPFFIIIPLITYIIIKKICANNIKMKIFFEKFTKKIILIGLGLTCIFWFLTIYFSLIFTIIIVAGGISVFLLLFSYINKRNTVNSFIKKYKNKIIMPSIGIPLILWIFSTWWGFLPTVIIILGFIGLYYGLRKISVVSQQRLFYGLVAGAIIFVLITLIIIVVFIIRLGYDAMFSNFLAFSTGVLTILALGLGYSVYKVLKKPQRLSIYSVVLIILFSFIITLLISNIINVFIIGWDIVFKTFITFFTTTASGVEGGILDCLVGTLMLTGGSILFAVPIGILAGVYLSEYAKEGKITKIIRAGIDNLNGTPSIIFGIFGALFFVRFLQIAGGHYSILAGQLTLALMILPTVIKTTEEAVKSIPQSFREGSLALGSTKWQSIYKVVLGAAVPGITTGVILGMGRSSGETAPIIHTAASTINRGLPFNIFLPGNALTYHIYILLVSFDRESAIIPAGGAALTLLILIILMYSITFVIRNHYQKKKIW
ncbi:MAG: phosphate ABC transporter permease subunit PstC [Candidatus Lokiarchaeota archaeon]|nr:phosphate ABC transporter permease subunit PstC [Candidatus Lokiarchaeota archaeon]